MVTLFFFYNTTQGLNYIQHKFGNIGLTKKEHSYLLRKFDFFLTP